MKRLISVFRVFLFLGALGSIGACLPEAGHLDTTGMISCGGASGGALATWANLRSVVDLTCFGSDCHTQGDREPILLGLNSVPLSDTDLYNKLTTYKSGPLCGGRMLVKPCAPDESAFYLAQAGSTTCSASLPQMPFGCDPKYDNCTPADKLEGIRQWIADGAPRP